MQLSVKSKLSKLYTYSATITAPLLIKVDAIQKIALAKILHKFWTQKHELWLQEYIALNSVLLTCRIAKYKYNVIVQIKDGCG